MSNQDSKAALAWRESLREGDEVVIGKLGRNLYVRKVIKVTATQIDFCGIRFNIKRGKPVNDPYGDDLFPLDDDMRQRLQAQQYRRDLAVITSTRTKLEDDEIAAMVEAYNAVKARKAAGGAA